MGAAHLRNLAKERGKNTQTEGMWGGGEIVFGFHCRGKYLR